MEGAAARNADVTVALARADEAMLMEELGCKTATVVLPALREDIRQLAITATPDSAATAAAAAGDFGGVVAAVVAKCKGNYSCAAFDCRPRRELCFLHRW